MEEEPCWSFVVDMKYQHLIHNRRLNYGFHSLLSSSWEVVVVLPSVKEGLEGSHLVFFSLVEELPLLVGGLILE